MTVVVVVLTLSRISKPIREIFATVEPGQRQSNDFYWRSFLCNNSSSSKHKFQLSQINLCEALTVSCLVLSHFVTSTSRSWFRIELNTESTVQSIIMKGLIFIYSLLPCKVRHQESVKFGGTWAWCLPFTLSGINYNPTLLLAVTVYQRVSRCVWHHQAIFRCLADNQCHRIL